VYAFEQAADPRELFERGMALLKARDLAGAESALKQAAELAPAQVAVWANLGAVQAQRGDHTGAIASYERALRLRPEDPALRVNIGLAWFRQSKFEPALAEFERAPGHPQARELRAVCLFQLGRYSEAAAVYEALPLETISKLYGLGEAQMRAGEKAAAAKTFERLFAAFPNAPETKLLSAQALMNEGRHEEALRTMQAVDLPGVDLWRGIAFEGLGRMDEALAAYRAEIARTGDLLGHYAAGAIEARSGDAERALAHLAAAKPLESDRYRVRYYAARAHLRLGRAEEARVALGEPATEEEHTLALQVFQKLGLADDVRRQADIVRKMKEEKRLREEKLLLGKP